MSDALEDSYAALRAAAATYPEAVEESPWGDRVFKARKKMFVMLSLKSDKLSFTFKLPLTGGAALERQEASPTGYGLGRHGWVSFRYTAGMQPPTDLLLGWLDESFRAVVPKRLIKLLETERVAAAAPVQMSPTGKRVVVAGNDPLRVDRAVGALSLAGVDALAVGFDACASAVADGAPDLVLVDLCRDAQRGVALLSELDLVGGGAPMVVAGLRGPKQEAQVRRECGTARLSRDAPGDVAVVDLVRRGLGL